VQAKQRNEGETKQKVKRRSQPSEATATYSTTPPSDGEAERPEEPSQSDKRAKQS